MVDGSSRLEVGNNKQADIPVLFFFSDGICERLLVSLLAFWFTLTTSFCDIQNNNT